MRTVKLFDFSLGDIENSPPNVKHLVESKLNGTPQGKWALDNGGTISFHLDVRIPEIGMRAIVTAIVTDKEATEFYLKYT